MSNGRYRAYPEYKDSAVEWLGRVPAEWGVRQLKFLCTHNDEVLPETTPKDFPIKYVDIGGVDATLGIKKVEDYCFSDAPSRARRIVKDGDVIISTVRTYLEAIAPISNPPDNLIVSTGFAVIRSKPNLSKGFAAYCLRAKGFIDQVVARSVGVSYPAINASDLVGIKIPLASLPEQTQIAAFLDHETAKIDRLIEKQEELIRLLKEKRQAVISHAVTKGLNPHAPLKDSGIEWLGQVPEHWVVLKLGHLVKFKGGAGFPEEFQGRTEDEIPFYKVGDLSRTDTTSYLTKPNHTITGTVAKQLRANIFETGTIVFAKVGAALLLKRFSVLPRPSCIDNNMMGAEIDDSTLRDFLLFLLPLLDFELIVNPGAVPSVNGEQIASIFVPLPPPDEQVTIISALRISSAQLDALIEKANLAITLLQERRTALISAAVTGKIDVRHWQPPVASETKTTADAVIHS